MGRNEAVEGLISHPESPYSLKFVQVLAPSTAILRFRREDGGGPEGRAAFGRKRLDAALAYIAENSRIWEVISA